MLGLALGLVLALSPKMEAAKRLTLDGDHETAARVLESMDPYSVSDPGEYYFYLLVNHFRLNEQEKAAADLKRVGSFNAMPRRREAVIFAIEDEMTKWRTGDLKDIARDMAVVADRLDYARGGTSTQTVQKRIVDKLDKLIKEQEIKGMASADKAGNPDRVGDGSGTGTPATDGNLLGQTGPGVVDEKKLRYYTDNWGRLPAAERERVVAALTRDYPPKYKPMIEEYFKALNRLKP